MPTEPIEWSVVIIGAWNRAILTPSGIAKRLFGLPPSTPIEIFVPLDAYAPFKVSHEGISVIAGSDRLIISPEKCQDTEMKRAMVVARKALEELPETPVSAAGFNFKYAAKKPIPSLASAVDHEIDIAFSDHDLLVLSRSITRSAKWKAGELRLSVIQEADQSFIVLANFHMESGEAAALKKWLATPIVAARRTLNLILHQFLGIPEGGIDDGNEEE